MDSSITSRLDEMESRLAFLDDAIETLNEVITRQDREISQLTQQVKALESKLNDIAESAAAPSDAAGHEIPPHD